MTELVTVTIISGIVTIATASVPVWLLLLNRRRLDAYHAENKAVLGEVQSTVSVVAEQTNGAMDKLLTATAEAQRAKGKLEGRAELKAEEFGTCENFSQIKRP